jgi:hypothetical protein
MERRNFIMTLPLLLWSSRMPASSGHPEPRPGITAANVVKRDELGNDANAIRVFDLVRQIPQIVDGIRCYCGCAEVPDFYSLLSCYEKDGMARYCEICQGEGEMVFLLHKKGQSLAEIRRAIDNKYKG